MKILICTFSFPAPKIGHFGGKFVLDEAVAYAENGAQVRVLTPYISGGNAKEEAFPGVTVFRFSYAWPQSRQKLLRINRPLYDQPSRLNFFLFPMLLGLYILQICRHAVWADLIHAQWTLTALLAIPAKILFGKKLVMTARGSDIRLLPRTLNQLIHHAVDGAIDCFGPQPWNENYKSQFKSNYLKLPLIVHNDGNGLFPEDVKSILEIPNKTFIVLYVGRFEAIKIKNSNLPLLDLMSAARIIKQMNRRFHLFYIGDGSLFKTMAERISNQQLADCVTLLGPKNNVFDYINICHLGAGGVAFNAVSEEFTLAGKPQLLIKDGCISTPWKDKENAIFVKSGNAKDIAEKILWGIDHPHLLMQIGKNAKMDMKEIITDTKRGGRIYLECFEKILKNM